MPKYASSQRLVEFREFLGLEYEDFAQKVGVDHTTVRRWEQGQTPMTQKTAFMLAGAFGISAKWLLTGEGDMMLPDKPRLGQEEADAAPNIVHIPLYALDASAGHGSLIDREPNVVAMMPFDRDWLRERIGVSARHLALIKVIGDSMSPTICNNDFVMIDLQAIHSHHFRDGIWVFRLGDAIHVKRVQQVGPATFKAISVNQDYGPITFDEDFQFIGRAVWSDKLW
jgi:phage repressor protein C with HTH and peptisase S24 domain